MNRVYRNALIAAVAAAALYAQDKPTIDREKLQVDMERAHEAVELARRQMADVHLNLDLNLEPMLLAQKVATDISEKVSEKVNEKMAEKWNELGKSHFIFDRGHDGYSRGLSALDSRDYDRALRDFDQYYKAASEKKEPRAEGALYWKAYALNKLGRRDESLATLAQLEKSYPSSRWMNDAKALQLEVRQASGQGGSPESQTDEDLKLIAINSLMGTDADRMVPLLEKLLGDAKASPRLKTRALFVLGQSRNPRAGDIIARYAKSSGNPDVQLKAVEYLGIYGTPQNKQVLADVYASATDVSMKRAVLRAWVNAKDKDHLLATAKSEKDADLRREAIRQLGGMGAHAELAQIYTTESTPELKKTIIQSLGGKREKTPELLIAMYTSEKDKNMKREILRSLHSQGAAKQLVDLARKETDPTLKTDAVRELSTMRSKESQDYMMELLNK
jgi:tetratricopeptide (TPR) repeat protein